MALDSRLSTALALQEQGDTQGAEALFREVLEDSPNDYIALFSLGYMACRRDDLLESLRLYDRAVAVFPQDPLVWFNRGTVQQMLRRDEQAVADFDRALEIDPRNGGVYRNRGAVLQDMGRHVEALANFEQMLRHLPGDPDALYNSGVLLGQLKRDAESLATFRELARVHPDQDWVLGRMVSAQLQACDWQDFEEGARRLSEGVAQGRRVCQPLGFFAVSDDADLHLPCARIFASTMYPAQEPLWRGEKYRHERIRLAYISPDLREHPVGHLTAGIFENHDRTRFETIAISLGSNDNSRIRKRMEAAFDRFIDARAMSSRDIAELMRSLEVDIAVDLAGFTADCRTPVLAQRPAPIQVNYLGYPGTMGLEYVDYILGDPVVTPESAAACFQEKIVRLPGAYLPFDDSLRPSDRTPSRAEHGLPETGFVFCSFNHSFKINPRVFDVWMRILKRTPGSVLWLMKLSTLAEANLRAEAQKRGVDPARLVFATRVPAIEDHLARYRLAGLFLDTAPYNAHTTASDALRTGLPVLTTLGQTFSGRVAASLLQALGLPELVTPSLEAYEELAVQLAADPDRVQALKAEVTRKLAASPHFNTRRLCRYLETAFQTMWQRHQDGLAPESFDVPEHGEAPVFAAPEQPRSAGPDKAEALRARVEALGPWHHRIELAHGVATPGWSPISVEHHGIPRRLDGLRVLDVSGGDGFWAFEALRRGAREVLAVGVPEQGPGSRAADERWRERFELCREALGLNPAACRRLDTPLYDLRRSELGLFDAVFCFGTLNRVRHPLLALDRLAELCAGELYVECAVLDDYSPYQGGLGHGYPGQQSVLEFYPGAEYGGDGRCRWSPTLHCLSQMAISSGFARVQNWKLMAETPDKLALCRGFLKASKGPGA